MIIPLLQMRNLGLGRERSIPCLRSLTVQGRARISTRCVAVVCTSRSYAHLQLVPFKRQYLVALESLAVTLQFPRGLVLLGGEL